MKGLSAIIAIIMLLLITVALAGSAYVWIVGTTTSLTTTGTQATQQVTTGMLAQMKVESAAGRSIYVRNTGKGTIENASLSVYIDDLRLGHSLSPLTLAENQVGELTLTDLWQLSLGKHTLKITTPSLQLQQAVEATPHSSVVGAWKMDEGSGTTASDSSGYGNDGTIFPATTYSTDSSGYIKDWIIIGMFSETDCACDAGTCDAFVSETSTLKYPGLTENGRAWFEHHNADNYIDLDGEVFEPAVDNDYVVAYTFVNVYSPTARNVQLRVGSDDGIKVWLNGNLVHDNGYACRGAAPDQDIIPVTLNKGWNYLLLRIGERGGGWAFLARFTDSGGNPQTDLRINLDLRDIKWVAGKFGSALQFDGVDDYVGLTNSFLMSRFESALSWWSNPQNTTSTGIFSNFNTGSYYSHLELGTTQIFGETDTNCNNIIFSTPKTVGWKHYVLVFDNAKAYLYVNGELFGESSDYGYVSGCAGQLATNLTNNLTLQYIGIKTAYNTYFNGIIDNVMVFNQALTPDETVSLKKV